MSAGSDYLPAMFNLFLLLHIIAGTVGLVIGPISMYSQKRKGLHTQVGAVYFYAMTLVCLSAVALAILHWEQSWWFVFVAAFSFFFAWKGKRAVKNRKVGWIKSHISGMLGSYIAMTTALLVVNVSSIPGHQTIPTFIYWMLPTIIGTPLIVRTIKEYSR